MRKRPCEHRRDDEEEKKGLRAEVEVGEEGNLTIVAGQLELGVSLASLVNVCPGRGRGWGQICALP